MSVVEAHITQTFTIFSQKWKLSFKVYVQCYTLTLIYFLSLCEKLVNVAMETDNLSLIDDMLTYVDHTPEHILVMLLTFLVDR